MEQRNQRRGRDKQQQSRTGDPELKERLVGINRVAKTTKGGRTFSFSSIMVIGDEKGKVGHGLGKSREVATAIQKGIEEAKKNMVKVPIVNGTIPHAQDMRYAGAHVMIRPASPGTGVIAGGAARQVLEVAGVKDILAKSLGSPTHLNVAKATINGLLSQRTPDLVAGLRGKKPSEVAPPGLVKAYEKTKAEKKVKVNDES